jgi:tetratricopeptide (TPR) repeat protein
MSAARRIAFIAVLLAPHAAQAQPQARAPSLSKPPPPSQPSPQSPPPAPAPAPTTPNPATAAPGGQELDRVFSGALRAYHEALAARRLGQPELRLEVVSLRVAEGEQLMGAGRVDEAIARLGELVEHPQFELFADSAEGRAAVFRLGDALAVAGIDEPARGYLRRLLKANGTWDDVWARRAVGRLVDVALESGEFAGAGEDLASVPASAPEQVRGEIAYLAGRAREAAGDPDGALSSYALVAQSCRFWAEATYLSGLIQVERGRAKEGENLLCKVADPARSATTTPVFADEKFFAVRDLARLGLGRIAHEQGRNDDARYYYYLVPRDSDRLAEALYEAATTRYEKKDYDGANELLAELARVGTHHRYEDEASVLGAWVDLARCRFADADKKLVDFVARYEPVDNAVRRIGENEVAMQRLLDAVHAGTDAAGAQVAGASPEVVRTIAALVRVDPAYDRVLRHRAVLEREASGLVHAMAAIGDMQRALSTGGGVRPTTEFGLDDAHKAQEARSGIDGVERQIGELEAAGAPAERLAGLRQALSELKARLSQGGTTSTDGAGEPTAAGADLPDLLRADAAKGAALGSRIAIARKELADSEIALAKDALRRLDLRLARLLRRARLGRIESVLGRKRALEVEVEAIRLGYLPQDAVDSLDAARYLEDNEEYWPFEGDNWPDEYVGTEAR